MQQRQIMDYQAELMMYRDLIKKLDPDHNYVFSPEYLAFLKTPKPDTPEPERLDRHREDSALQVVSLTEDMQHALPVVKGAVPPDEVRTVGLKAKGVPNE
jgi:hypothetical protein